MANRDDIKRRVLESTDIQQLIGEHVVLRARGRELVGLCPFHDDRKPSMTVVPAKQIFKCFACGAGGDALSFMMRYHTMEFPEALRALADRAGIEMPRHGSGGADAEGESPRQQVLKANEFAAAFFANALADPTGGKAARDYVAQRDINAAMIDAFRIGYAPDGYEALTKQVAARKHDRRAFEAADLLRKRDDGSSYDRFRHRLIFPIIDSLNRVIAFGGRKLREEDEPKYLNSSETAVFDKSGTLFGMHLAQKAMLETRTAVIVEGYTDVIAAHQAGFANVVATLGTALTERHAKLLRRYADRVVLVFDADEAGQKAADRAVSVFFAEPIDVAIAVLPDGLDPADLLAKDNGPHDWRAAIEAAGDALAFQFERVRGAFEGASTLAAKHRVTEDYLRMLVQLGFAKLDTTRRGQLIGRIADMLRTDVASIDRMLRAMAKPRRAAEPPIAPAPAAAVAPTGIAIAERSLVGALLNRPDLLHAHLDDGVEVGECIVAGDLGDDAASRVYHALYEWLLDAGHEGEPTAAQPLSAADLRDLLTHEHLIEQAIAMQIEVDRLSGGDGARLVAQLTAAAGAIRSRRVELDYRRQKMDSPREAGGDLAEQVRRLNLAAAHINANPSAARSPRVAGAP